MPSSTAILNVQLIFDSCFPCTWSIFAYSKKWIKKSVSNFVLKIKIKCADAFRMLTVAYGKTTLDRSNVYRWYKMFSASREDVNDEERAGRPSTSTTHENFDEVKKIVLVNRWMTIGEVAEDHIDWLVAFDFYQWFGMTRVAAKFIPKLLNFDQKQHRIAIAYQILDSVRDDPNLLQRVTTGDESVFYGYDVET